MHFTDSKNVIFISLNFIYLKINIYHIFAYVNTAVVVSKISVEVFFVCMKRTLIGETGAERNAKLYCNFSVIIFEDRQKIINHF